MTIDVALSHRTEYRFDRRVGLSPHVIRLRPAPHCRTPIRAYSLRIEPEDHYINWMQDPFGNFEARIVFPEKTRELIVDVEVIADMTTINPFDFFLEEQAEEFPFSYSNTDADSESSLAADLAPYLRKLPTGPLLKDWLRRWQKSEESKVTRTIDYLVALNSRLRDDVDYTVRMEPGVQSAEETLQRAIGSCRDSAWLLVQILRHLGLAARFVSGYLVQLKPDIAAIDGPTGPTEDFTDLHAWTEVFLPGAGWVGMDPTSGLFAGEGHIPLACTPEPGSAAPISGATDECEVEFAFSNTVSRFHEDPRVTAPFPDEVWDRINATGLQVDAMLAKGDVRLTMGGEPTFVAENHNESEQWNTAADGREKRVMAEALARDLQKQFAPGGVLHYGQGKWYPGEPLPRWKKTCFWRNDGVAVWRDTGRLATPADGGEPAGTHTSKDLSTLAKALCDRLGINKQRLIEAYEDPLHALLEQRTLPANIDAELLQAADEKTRDALAQRLENTSEEVAGYVLPLQYDTVADNFETSRWPLRRPRLYLMPGDSPIGLRLPLGALPLQLDPEGNPEAPAIPDQPDDPMTWRTPADAQPEPSATPLQTVDRKDEVVRAALCLECRNGVLCLFLPPLPSARAWLDLLAQIEEAAVKADVTILLEGYEPPGDGLLEDFSVTPDPGVIEVNIHPSTDWPSNVERTEALYEIARQNRLSAEKFMQDGRHTGTGGGNHVVLGGATPSESPFLRRPDLLRSMITYWQRHPCLSYLFSGMFVGPTSQSPRVDESRLDRLYDLEIAFSQMPDGEVEQPWMIDRLLRHLLTDLTGNTHRSEFCIDKLYSPDSAAGRRGLLELRSFEMPPHPRLALLQSLLVRALIAMFWEKPITGSLVRWGTALHDRFLLPHFNRQDMKEIVSDLRAHGIPMQLEWFDAFFEFRFPRHGAVAIDDVQLELRGAIEPWQVLGEEVTATGTARYVDSSVERLQVRAQGLIPGRHALACNGLRVPMKPTETPGEFIAGIRYKAWQPPSGMHPMLPIDTPLVIDLIDLWNGRTLGGCTYHVAHAGGRNPETSPVNALEAESRRMARFDNFGHTISAPQQAPEPVTTWQRSQRFEPNGSAPDRYNFAAQTPLQDPVLTESALTLDMRTRPIQTP